MELKDLITLTTNLSFSIAVAWFLLIFVTKKVTSAIEALSKTLISINSVLQDMNTALQVLLLDSMKGGHKDDLLMALKNLSANDKGRDKEPADIRT